MIKMSSVNMDRTARNDRNSNISVKNDKKADRKKYINYQLNNKVKVQLWEQRRQKNFKRRYNKEYKRNKSSEAIEEHTEQIDTSENNGRLGIFKAAQLEIQRKKEEKRRLFQEKLQKKNEIEQAISEYKKKKAEKFKKLSKKTKRGQPVMRDRIQLLYEEIKQKVSNENT
ncbi:uncharacterized protein [Halyomorpha halys]|uniref:uncharacterized protein n=1 Tax=Halyomorpha halys TaxID=286706 RepID=UPI0006D4CEF3|nr:rRNA-processing protein FYV7 [Halyomorpha halys]